MQQLLSDSTGSKTIKQSGFATALWLAANHFGYVIPWEVLAALVAGIGIKEGAGKLKK